MQTTGKAAYAPAKLDIWASWRFPGMNACEKVVMEQIFVTCRRNAKTQAEIAAEIGLNEMYLSPFLAYLTENKLLKTPSEGKYLTDFCMMPAQALYDARAAVAKIYENIGAEITAAIEQKKDELLAFEFYGKGFDWNYLLWYFYFIAKQRLQYTMGEKNKANWLDKMPQELNNRPNFRAAAAYTLPEETEPTNPLHTFPYGGENGGGTCHYHYHSEPDPVYGRMAMTDLMGAPFPSEWYFPSNPPLMVRVAESGGTYQPVNETESEHIKKMQTLGFVRESDGKFLVPIIARQTWSGMHSCLDEATAPLADKYLSHVNDALEKTIRPHIREELMGEYAYYLIPRFYNTAPYLFQWATEVGKTLYIPTDYSTDMVGMVLFIHNSQ
jgi:hypothetical protein